MSCLSLPGLGQHAAGAGLVALGHREAAGDRTDAALDRARVAVQQDRVDPSIGEQRLKETQPNRIIGAGNRSHGGLVYQVAR